MTESTLKSACRKIVERSLPRAHVANVQDRFVGGRPDTQVTWSGHTSFLEFKFLGPAEALHGPLRKDQLEELIDLEYASCGRSWVVVYRKGGRFTDIYRPSALRRISDVGQLETCEPEPETSYSELRLTTLRSTGVIRLAGHDHHAVATLIRLTHEGY